MSVENHLHPQSAHIAQGVDNDGAGDQGIMFGYACTETPELMPAPIQYSHAILRNLAEARHAGDLPQLGPDAKSQLSVKYEDGKPVGVTSIVLSTQHLDENMSSKDVQDVVEPYIRKTLPDGWISGETEWHVNPTGKFVIGGPDGDAGLTGRKIIVDTYGGAAPHGGGAFSGKDPTKVDRSAAYAARYLAKNVVAAGLAKRCTIQLSYAIGVAKPLSIYCDTHGTGEVHESAIEQAVAQAMDLTPRGIIEHLQLRTNQSMSGQRPMATLAARRKLMVGSAGKRLIWLKSLKKRFEHDRGLKPALRNLKALDCIWSLFQLGAFA